MQSQDESFQPRDRRPWTEDEDEALRMAIEEEDSDSNPPTRWHAISQHIPNRTNKDCRKRWWAQMATIVSKGSWTSDEDERLCSAVAELGPKWALVANRVRTRNSGQCAKRWNDALNPTIDRSGWSQEEDEQLLRAVEEHGHSWANIARTSLPGRTGLAAKNRYNHLMRGVCRPGGRRSRRTSAASSVPVRRRTRGDSAVSVSALSALPSQWPPSQLSSDSSDAGTTPSTPRSFTEDDDVYLHSGTNIVTPAFMNESTLEPRFSSPLSSIPSSADQHLMDLFMTSAGMGETLSPDDFSTPSSSYDWTSSSSYFSQTPPDLLGDDASLNLLPMWSPCTSGPTTPLDSFAIDHTLAVSSRSPGLYPAVAPAETHKLHSPHGDSMLSTSDYLRAHLPTEVHHQSPFMLQSIPDLSQAVMDAQVTIGCVPDFPDKASIQLAKSSSADPSDRRVAVAVAICDQQDVMSTVHSLSQSLSTMLGQGQLPNPDSESTTSYLNSPLPLPETGSGLWRP